MLEINKNDAVDLCDWLVDQLEACGWARRNNQWYSPMNHPAAHKPRGRREAIETFLQDCLEARQHGATERSMWTYLTGVEANRVIGRMVDTMQRYCAISPTGTLNDDVSLFIQQCYNTAIG